ncbi:hypothetical protein [Nisaea sp.]|uniref:hypothetical protein n=1 Tax=Nisaea sp. TaxID=2024842 RepID=UPI0032EC42D9
MDHDTPPSWDFFGTVERLIRATEMLVDQYPEGSGANQDLLQSMLMRLTVIMEDSAGYLAQEDPGQRSNLEDRLSSIRTRVSSNHRDLAPSRASHSALDHNVRQLSRLPN